MFVDIAGSTKMKDEALYRWASKIYNAFVKTQMFMPIGSFPLKSMGDALLYFIPKTAIRDTQQVPLELFAGLHRRLRLCRAGGDPGRRLSRELQLQRVEQQA